MHLKYTWIYNILIAILVLKLDALKDENELKKPSPIILVPGSGASRAYSYVGCNNNHKDASLIWLNLQYLASPSRLTDILKLNYNPATHNTSDAECSEVFFPGWGSTEMIEYLNDNKGLESVYFSTLVEGLVQDKYYIRNKTIRGAPYDFRKAPNENKHFVCDMKKLVEDTYKLSQKRRVVILGHSMGSIYTLFFLKKMPTWWKKKYIRSFISVSAPLGGAVEGLVREMIGSNLGTMGSPKVFMDLLRSFPSTALCLPRPEIFGNKAIIITPQRNYSAYDQKALFKDINALTVSMMYDDTRYLVKGDETPKGVDELYCIHSSGVPTPDQMIFKSLEDDKPVAINGDGDNVVNINSLELCKKWKNVRYDNSIKGFQHTLILSSPDFVTKIKKILYR